MTSKAVVQMAALCAILFLTDPQSLRAQASTVTCSSQEGGERQHCVADTSAGVALQRSLGTVECLLGKSWGYDDMGVWVRTVARGSLSSVWRPYGAAASTA